MAKKSNKKRAHEQIAKDLREATMQRGRRKGGKKPTKALPATWEPHVFTQSATKIKRCSICNKTRDNSVHIAPPSERTQRRHKHAVVVDGLHNFLAYATRVASELRVSEYKLANWLLYYVFKQEALHISKDEGDHKMTMRDYLQMEREMAAEEHEYGEDCVREIQAIGEEYDKHYDTPLWGAMPGELK